MKVRQFQKALCYVDRALLRDISESERAICEIEKGDILMIMGRRKEAREIYGRVWKQRHQLPSDILEDIKHSFMMCFARVGDVQGSLKIFLEAEKLENWRKSVRN